MSKRPEQIFKLLCLLLAAVLALEVARVAARGKPLSSLTIPALPTFAAASDSTNSASAQNAKATNGANAQATNAADGSRTAKSGTNQATSKAETNGTNKTAEPAKAGTNGTNIAVAKNTNTPETKAEANETNVVTVATESSTASPTANSSAQNATDAALTNISNATNQTKVAQANSGTNAVASGGTTNKTNTIEKTLGGTETNSAVAQKSPGKGSGPGARPDTGKKSPDVPPAVKARIDRITQSEILAPVMHPMPMALLGIAGDEALIRSPEGQTGMIKEGKELGSIKLLKIGTNRVLIEEKGEKKELMIFSGFGGESLMPKEEKKTAEAKKDAKPEPKKTEEKDNKPNEPIKKSA